MRAELPLELGPGRARLDPRRARDGIDLEHPVQRAQAQADRAGVAAGPRVDPADDAGTATGGYDREVLLRGPGEHRAQLVLVARRGDRVGRMREAAAEAAHDVEVGATVRVQRPRVRVLVSGSPGGSATRGAGKRTASSATGCSASGEPKPRCAASPAAAARSSSADGHSSSYPQPQ